MVQKDLLILVVPGVLPLLQDLLVQEILMALVFPSHQLGHQSQWVREVLMDHWVLCFHLFLCHLWHQWDQMVLSNLLVQQFLYFLVHQFVRLHLVDHWVHLVQQDLCIQLLPWNQ